MRENPGTQESSQAKIIILILAGLFVACISLGIVICIVFSQSEQGKQFWEGFKKGTSAVSSSKHKDPAAAETEHLAEIARATATKNPTKIMQAEFRYADWLQSKSRSIEAQSHFIEAYKIADHSHWNNWRASCLERRAWGQHKMFIAGQADRPDVALMEEAITLKENGQAGEKSSLASWLNKMAVIYGDNGMYEKALDTIARASKQEDIEDKDLIPDTLVYRAEICVRKNDLKEAGRSFAEASAYGLKKHARSASRELISVMRDLDDGSRYRELLTLPKKMLDQGKLAELDKMAEELRSSKAMYSSGNWHLDTFYNSLDLDEDDSENAWKTHFANLRKWVAQSPDSQTARVALAQNLVTYAWRARGGGYSSTVSDEGWKSFEKRLEEASQVLLEAHSKNETMCPRWYSVSQSVALGQGWTKDKYEGLMQECIKTHPTYYTVLFNESWFLQPRWYGDGQEWVKVATEHADRLGGTEGDMLYARIIWSMDSMIQYDNLFRDFPDILWPRLQRGMEALKKQYPKSSWITVEQMKMFAQTRQQQS